MRRHYLSFDFFLAAAVIVLSIFGIIIIGSATRVKTLGPSAEYTGQITWFVLGLALMLAAAFVDYHFICKFYIPVFVVNILLLVAVLLIDKGDAATARRLNFGSMSILPSEFSKIFMIVFLSSLIDKKKEYLQKIPMVLLLLLCTIVPVVLIMLQPSLSASMVTVFVFLVILFAAGLRYRYFLGALALVIPVVVFVYIDIHRETPFLVSAKILQSYQITRIMDSLYPDPYSAEAWQQQQSVKAIGSGQLYGTDLHNGMISQSGRLPASHNDFIFAVIGEELGFAGCMIVLAVSLFIIAKCFLIAYKATDYLGRLLAAGVGGMLAFQVFVNVGVATDILINTGIAYPFVSAGGSAMWVCMLGIGLVLNVGMSKTRSIFETT